MKRNYALKYVKKMRSYLPPLEGRNGYDGVLLDFNERVSCVSPEVREAVLRFAEHPFQVYPEYGDLEKRIARYVGVKAKQVLATNGSDQAIDIVFRTFAKKGDEVIVPVPTFALLEQAARKQGCAVKTLRYEGEEMRYPIEVVLSSIRKKTRMVVVCNPNNPTGTGVSVGEIEAIALALDNGVVLVDEAYFEFSGITAVSLIDKHPNVLVTRTLSKSFGLPSLRFGYLVATSEHISECKKIRDPYDVNMLSAEVAKVALNAPAYSLRYARTVMTKSKPMLEKFFEENKVPFVRSVANFMLFKPSVPPMQAYRVLKENGILVRPQKQAGLEMYLRVSVGRVPDMIKFMSVYKKEILRKPQKVAFIDRDGTLIFEPQDTFQVDSVKSLRVLGGVIEGLQRLQNAGYMLVMVTNQDGLGTELYPQKKFEKVQERLLGELSKHGIMFSEVLVCPHVEEDDCLCRKPKLGLVSSLLERIKLNKGASFVCGDRETDKEFAKALGVRFQGMKTNGNFGNAVRAVFRARE